MTSKIYSDPEIMKIKQGLEIDSEIVRQYWYRSTFSFNMAVILHSAGAVTLAIGIMELLIGFSAGLLLSVAIAVFFFFLGNRFYGRFEKIEWEFAEWKVKNEQV